MAACIPFAMFCTWLMLSLAERGSICFITFKKAFFLCWIRMWTTELWMLCLMLGWDSCTKCAILMQSHFPAQKVWEWQKLLRSAKTVWKPRVRPLTPVWVPKKCWVCSMSLLYDSGVVGYQWLQHHMFVFCHQRWEGRSRLYFRLLKGH